MLVLALCVIAVLSPLVAWRWPAGLVQRKWRWPILIWVALLLQIAAFRVEALEDITEILHVLTYVVAGGFLWMNRDAAGIWIVAAGALSNGITIALNGGVLPASQAATDAAGINPDPEHSNTAVLEDPVLPWLGDVFAWPAPMPLANTFSVGDVLIVVGVFVAAWSGSRRIGSGGAGDGNRTRAISLGS